MNLFEKYMGNTLFRKLIALKNIYIYIVERTVPVALLVCHFDVYDLALPPVSSNYSQATVE